MIDIAAIASPVVRAALVRDHGATPAITRQFGDDRYEVGRIVWEYAPDGTLTDSFRLSHPSRLFGSVHRREIDRRGMALKPADLVHVAVEPAEFYVLSRKMDGHYDHCEAKTSTAWAVCFQGVQIGIVARVRFTDDERFEKPAVQWLAVGNDGRVWSGYGVTREEASRHLLKRHVTDAALPLAA